MCWAVEGGLPVQARQHQGGCVQTLAAHGRLPRPQVQPAAPALPQPDAPVQLLPPGKPLCMLHRSAVLHTLAVVKQQAPERDRRRRLGSILGMPHSCRLHTPRLQACAGESRVTGWAACVLSARAASLHRLHRAPAAESGKQRPAVPPAQCLTSSLDTLTDDFAMLAPCLPTCTSSFM